MERLIELAKIVSKEKTKRVNIIGQNKKGNSSLTQKLYEGIISDKIKTDQEAGKLLYGKQFDQNTYIRTKYRLEEKLLNTLFFINLNESHYTNLQKNYYKNNKDAAAVKFLIGKSARNTAIALAEKTIRQAIKYEFTEIILDLGRILKKHYRLFNPNRDKANHYIEIVNYYKKVLDLEITAEDYREEINSQHTTSRATQSYLKEKVIEYERYLKLQLESYSSYKLKLSYYMIANLRFRVVNDHEQVIKVCQEALVYFESESNNKSGAAISIFCIEIIFSCISIKHFDLGEKMFRKAIGVIKKGALNWFVAMEGFMLLCFHTQRTEEAYNVLIQVINNKNYAQIPKQYQEIWKVYNAYCHFLIDAKDKRLALDLKGKTIKPFRLAKFLNEVPQYSKDKQGINISILIIQVLFLLNKKKRDVIIERVEALTQYSYRYLIKDETLRSNCFIKMLAKMVKANFHKNATERTTQKLLKKLKETPSSSKGQSQYVEIIPYETLWEIVVNSLTNRAI